MHSYHIESVERGISGAHSYHIESVDRESIVTCTL